MAQHRKHPDDPIFRFISMANAVPPLPREQELSDARAYLERGDQQAKHRILRAALRNVVAVALRYRQSGIPLAELIAQGNLALVAALDRFEPERGLRFATYATHWVRAEILGLVLSQRSMVGGGKGPLRGKFVFRFRREHAELMGKLGDEDAVLQQLAPRFRKTPQQLRDILARIDSRDASLETRVGDGSDSAGALSDVIASDGQAPEDEVAAQQRRAQLAAAVRKVTRDLSDRERFLVEHRLMADTESRMSLVNVGRHFGVTRERARQIEAGLKLKLRKRLGENVDAGILPQAA